MSSLQFAYAAPRQTSVPREVARTLRADRKWRVFSWELSAIEELTTPPDFLWVNFGKGPKLPDAEIVLKHLANLQSAKGKHAFYFFSGAPGSRAIRRSLIKQIFATLPNPTDVVADLAGQPDWDAAFAKFWAQRTAQARQTVPMAKPAVTVPDADLRSERGRLSIKPIAELFGMDVIEIGRLIGHDNKAALSKTPDVESLQGALQPFADIALLRAPDFGDEQFRKWLNAPNEHMQNRAPIAWIREGRVRDVAGFVYGILTGQPT